MCSITGIISRQGKDVYLPLLDLLNNQRHRGSDSFGISIGNETNKVEKIKSLADKFLAGSIGLAHGRLAVTGHGFQPLESCDSKISLIHNGEIYNFKDLSQNLSSHNFKTSTDSEAIVHFLEEAMKRMPVEKAVQAFMQQANGSYSVAFKYNGKLYAFRDPIGIKPLWFGSSQEFFAFASEPQVLKILDIYFPQPLLPGHLLIASNSGISTQKIYSTADFISSKFPNSSVEQLKSAFISAVSTRSENVKKAGIFFSGGIDSSLVAKVASEFIPEICLYTVGLKDSNDIKASELIAKELGLKLKTKIIDKDEILPFTVKTLKCLNIFDRMQLDVGLPLYIASSLAAKDNCRVVFSGQGSDEIFCGYSSYKGILKEHGYSGVEKEISSSLENMWSRNLYRDEIITMQHSLELRLPFLDLNFLRHVLAIKPEYKISSPTDNLRKHALREMATMLNMPKQLQTMQKKAIQYGSGLSKELDKILN